MSWRTVNCGNGAIARLRVWIHDLAQSFTQDTICHAQAVPTVGLRQLLVVSDDEKVVDCVRQTKKNVDNLRKILNNTSRQVGEMRKARKMAEARCEERRGQLPRTQTRAERECGCKRRALADLWMAFGMVGELLEECKALRKQLQR